MINVVEGEGMEGGCRWEGERFAGGRQGEVGHGGVGWCGWGVVLPSMTASTDEEYMVWGWAGWDPGTHPAHPIQATTYSHRVFVFFNSHKLALCKILHPLKTSKADAAEHPSTSIATESARSPVAQSH